MSEAAGAEAGEGHAMGNHSTPQSKLLITVKARQAEGKGKQALRNLPSAVLSEMEWFWSENVGQVFRNPVQNLLCVELENGTCCWRSNGWSESPHDTTQTTQNLGEKSAPEHTPPRPHITHHTSQTTHHTPQHTRHTSQTTHHTYHTSQTTHHSREKAASRAHTSPWTPTSFPHYTTPHWQRHAGTHGHPPTHTHAGRQAHVSLLQSAHRKSERRTHARPPPSPGCKTPAVPRPRCAAPSCRPARCAPALPAAPRWTPCAPPGRRRTAPSCTYPHSAGCRLAPGFPPSPSRSTASPQGTCAVAGSSSLVAVQANRHVCGCSGRHSSTVSPHLTPGPNCTTLPPCLVH